MFLWTVQQPNGFMNWSAPSLWDKVLQYCCPSRDKVLFPDQHKYLCLSLFDCLVAVSYTCTASHYNSVLHTASTTAVKEWKCVKHVVSYVELSEKVRWRDSERGKFGNEGERKDWEWEKWFGNERKVWEERGKLGYRREGLVWVLFIAFNFIKEWNYIQIIVWECISNYGMGACGGSRFTVLKTRVIINSRIVLFIRGEYIGCMWHNTVVIMIWSATTLLLFFFYAAECTGLQLSSNPSSFQSPTLSKTYCQPTYATTHNS